MGSHWNATEALPRFGLSQFRPGQAEVIDHILEGHDCLCVMPTGGGKSLCYQLPAVVRPGLTVVVSPLIALMKDQVDALQRRSISATLINSTLTMGEQSERLQEVAQGKYSLVYVAPERLRNPRFLEALRATPIQLLAIDEAHCISEWGHDFRPDYSRIGAFRQWLGGVQTVALTATATPRVRQDIVQLLGLQQPQQFITGFARKNLHFGVIPCHSDREKDRQLIEFLKSGPGAGIIYAATRKRCEELVERLGQEVKLPVAAYHAGLAPEQRRFVQDRFMRGEYPAIVATNAFGMGIDKSDLRFVVHYNLPGSLEAYYQEAGRAGRDGLASQCVLLFSGQDRYIQEFFIENAYPPREMVQRVYEYIQGLDADPIEMTLQEMRDALQIEMTAESIGTALQWISRSGVIERLDSGAGQAMVRISSDLPTLVELLPRTSQRRRKVLRALEQMVGDRRYESVYFSLGTLANRTEIERDPLQEVLRSLSQLEAIEYVPPFRGRAIHFRKRDVPFDQLKIDFQTLDARKAADYDKLDQTIAYAQGKLCRQMAVLRYFGDPEARPCGSCDRCLNQSGWFSIDPGPTPVGRVLGAGDAAVATAPDASDSQQEAAIARSVRKVLQAVGRLHGRLGKTLVAQFLTGSENAKIQRLRLSKLEGFGLLKAWKQAEANGLLESLLSAGVLEQTELQKHRPLLGLSALGKEVAAGKELLPTGIRWPGAVAMRLRSLDGIPQTPAGQPAAAAKPKASAGIEGQESTGQASFKGDGSTMNSAPLEAKEATKEDLIDGGLQESDHWEWTWRLASAGYTLAQCAASRRKTWREVLRDLRRAAQNGRSLEIDRLLEPDLCQLLRSKWSLERDRQLGQLDYGQELIGLWQSLQTQGRGA